MTYSYDSVNLNNVSKHTLLQRIDPERLKSLILRRTERHTGTHPGHTVRASSAPRGKSGLDTGLLGLIGGTLALLIFVGFAAIVAGVVLMSDSSEAANQPVRDPAIAPGNPGAGQPIQPGQPGNTETVEGALTPQSDQLDSGSYVTILGNPQITAGTYVRIEVEAEFQAIVAIRPPNSEAVANPGRIEFEAPVTGEYLIAIMGPPGQTGRFRVHITAQ